jgi:Na+-transporting methylmalonyl-CoA/oxaloacetate decarboxylase gamma subunit
VLWGETDAEDLWIWPTCDNAFLVIFLLELILRFMHIGILICFTGKERWWNVLDSVIVIFGIVDIWVGPILAEHKKAKDIVIKQGDGPVVRVHPPENGHISSLLRFLRLLRLLRLIRIFKMVRRLKVFMEGLYSMIESVIVILIFLFTMILIVAIIMTQVVRSYREDPDIPEEGREFLDHNFHCVMASVFTLFQVTTMDNWYTIAYPLIEADRRWEVFFVVFIAFTSWTMISILTAVACDSMMNAVAMKVEKEREEQERKQKEFIKLLRKAFKDADDDGNGELDRDEFDQFLESESLQSLFAKLNIPFNKDELKKRFDLLDVTGAGHLTIDEFVEGLAAYHEGLSTKHVVNLDYSVRRLEVNFDKRIKELEHHAELLKRRNIILLENMRKQEQIYQQQHCAIYAWQQWALQVNAQAFPTEYVKKVAATQSSWHPPSLEYISQPSQERLEWTREPKDAI